MKIISWNVNGLRAATKKGFKSWFRSSGADIIGLQEVRALPEQLDPTIANPRGWRTAFNPAERKGYSGVGLLTTADHAPDAVISNLDAPEFDIEGRLQIAEFGELMVANVYFPNGSGKNRDNSRVPYKLAFYDALFDRLEPARAAGRPVLIMGDMNTAHREIDLARPKSNRKTSGFLDVERDHFTGLLGRGWTDTFRHLHGDVEGRYTWWSQRFGVREKNVGWRIDYVLASAGALPFVKEAFILSDQMGSDHCPIGVVVDPFILKA